ncbi:MAG: 50S ribosomal protein L30 [Thermoleophilaceae bacterium]|jgi:large subunit ribosomal protein L30|nr:50S ribosomal protein L30 [Thermoleophilaceae bacterium]
MAEKLVITQVKSPIGSSKKQRATLQSLGLGRIGKRVEHPDGEALRGQLHAVRHLLEVMDTREASRKASV